MLANERIVVTTMTTMGTMDHQKQTASSASSINPTPSSSSTFSSTSSLGSVKNHVGKAHDMIAQHDANCVPAKTNQSTQSTSHNATQTNPVQVQNYIHWINTHLKKRPGVKLLENLQTDLCSGVALVHLIEVISGTFVADINLNPRTRQDCVENIEKILSFMQSRAIKMHQITSNEILDGNLKSIMRLVLALAAHFKPSNVQPYSAAMCHQMKQQQQGLNPTSNRTYNKPGSSDQKYHEAPANTFNRPSSSLAATATSSSSIQNHKTSTAPSVAAAFGKRSQSSNNVHSNHHHLVSRQTVTFIPPPNYQNDVLLQNGATNPEPPPQHQGRNLDSMTHLVQAACVSISDVRRYKNENFNIKYVRRNNLQSSNNVCTNNGINRVTSSSNANYLNPINIQNPNNNQTYVKDVAGKEIESSNGKMAAMGGSPPSHPPPPPPQYPTSPPHHRQPFVETTLLMSPSQPIASSTVIQAPTFFRTPTSSPAHSSTKIVNTTPRRSISASKNMTYVVGEELKRQQQQQQQKEESEEQDKTATPIRLEMELHGANEVKIVNSQVVGSVKPNVDMTDNPINNANSNDKTRIINPTNSNTNTTTVEKNKPAEEKIIDLNLELVETDLEDVQKLKATLIKLQSMIMNGNNNADDKEESLGMSNTLVRAEPINPVAKEDEENSEKDDDWSSKSSSSSIDEQLAMYRSKLQQLEIANTDLRRALDEERSNSNTAKTCACGLKIRVGEQEAAILEMRSANIEMQLSKEQLETEKNALAEQLSVATRHLMQCKYEMAQKDAMIERIGLELAELKKETEQMRIVKQQVKRVSDTLELVQEKENALNSMLSNTDRKLDLIDSKLNKTNTNKEQQIVGLLTTTTTNNGEAIELHDRLKENLGKLKLIANSNNQPFEHSQLAQIERNLWSLVDKILNQQHNNHEERSSSSSSSGSSSPLTSSSSCSPVLLNDALQQQQQDSATTTVSIESQPTAEQTSPSSLSTRSSSSSSTSLTAATTAQQTTTTVISDVNESNVKKIISRLLSQNYVTENKGQSQRGSKQSTSATALLTLSTASSSIVTNPNHTQCLYYLDKASNPNCVTIFKKIDEITLNDFKSIVKLKPGNYKFRFKSLDPEFGFLKEEISCDNKVLPKCEGKIVAWIETC